MPWSLEKSISNDKEEDLSHFSPPSLASLCTRYLRSHAKEMMHRGKSLQGLPDAFAREVSTLVVVYTLVFNLCCNVLHA